MIIVPRRAVTYSILITASYQQIKNSSIHAECVLMVNIARGFFERWLAMKRFVRESAVLPRIKPDDDLMRMHRSNRAHQLLAGYGDLVSQFQ
jgi:hypothetical protein